MTDDTTKLYVKEQNEKERETSDERYALKWVERGTLAVLGILGLAIVAKFKALIGL